VADWWHTHRHRGPGEPEPVMLAATLADTADLNLRARKHLAAAGRLGPDLLELDGRAFAVGDRVVCLRNDYRLDVLNGDCATLISIDPDRVAVTVGLDDGRRVELPAGYLLGPDGQRQVDHAYALTGHKAQGMTGGRVFILVDEGLYREWAYVALSRGRLDNRLYAAEDLARDLDLDQPRQPARDVPAFLAHALAGSRAKTLALDRQQADTGLGIDL
jgi:ATP-dependent exoDNAse (exonuclease V) alpha subunit